VTYSETKLGLPPELLPPVVVERPEGSGTFVRLSDSYLWQIVYLGIQHADKEHEMTVQGTGFLLAHDGATYIVTAAHVAAVLDDCPIGVRLNREDDGLGNVDRIDHAKWYYHPSDDVDVAIMPYSPPRWAKVNYAKSKWIANEFKVHSKNIGPGDLAYVVGIFQKMRGKDKNMPVVHVGHIGSMATGEKFLVDDWRSGRSGDIEISGYVIQVSTLSESSGSPVYVRRSFRVTGVEEVDTEKKIASPLNAWMYGSVWLLGVWSGKWDADEDGVTVGANTGVCTPALSILETLERPELKAMRKTANDKAKQESKLTLQRADGSIAKLRDETLRTMLSTPPQPRTLPARKRVKRK
jgi:hypothetical protein